MSNLVRCPRCNIALISEEAILHQCRTKIIDIKYKWYVSSNLEKFGDVVIVEDQDGTLYRISAEKLQQHNSNQSAEDDTEPNIERYIRFRTFVKIMSNSKREMYVCFSKEEISLLEDYAKNKGALNISQALESLVKEKKY